MKPSLILNLKDQRLGRRPACKDRFAQRSPVQVATTLDVAIFCYLAINAVPTLLQGKRTEENSLFTVSDS
ncbi:hypothetical protein J6590_001746 [Homalodisca vitripennis]|nr:hypothetical protein J6590_001746 [Homalodisca vitripennis]